MAHISKAKTISVNSKMTNYKSMRLRGLVNKLKKAVAESEQKLQTQLAAEISRRFMIKYKRCSSNRFGYQIQAWADTIKASPNQIESLCELDEFKIILKRDVDITHHSSEKEVSLYSEDSKVPIEIVRFPNKMIFLNPFKEKIESWARPKSISGMQGKHRPRHKNPHGSNFYEGLNIEGIDLLLFKNAHGVIKNEREIYLYACFDDNVGTIKTTNKKSNIVRCRCERRKEGNGKNYCTELHSYPFSSTEFQRDLKNNLALLSIINDNPLSLP